jgi:hypothetical protein
MRRKLQQKKKITRPKKPVMRFAVMPKGALPGETQSQAEERLGTRTSGALKKRKNPNERKTLRKKPVKKRSRYRELLRKKIEWLKKKRWLKKRKTKPVPKIDKPSKPRPLPKRPSPPPKKDPGPPFYLGPQKKGETKVEYMKRMREENKNRRKLY